MGFFIMDPDQGRVLGQFPHLFPASIAIGYGLDGLTGARRGRRSSGRFSACSRSISPARACSAAPAGAGRRGAARRSRDPGLVRALSERRSRDAGAAVRRAARMARAHVDDDRFFAPVAASLLGLLLFLRFDAVLGRRRRRRRRGARPRRRAARRSCGVPGHARAVAALAGALPVRADAPYMASADRLPREPAGVADARARRSPRCSAALLLAGAARLPGDAAARCRCCRRRWSSWRSCGRRLRLLPASAGRPHSPTTTRSRCAPSRLLPDAVRPRSPRWSATSLLSRRGSARDPVFFAHRRRLRASSSSTRSGSSPSTSGWRGGSCR